MNPSKNGLSSAGKTGIVVVLIIVVLGAAYLAPSLMKGGGTKSTSSQLGGSSSSPGGNQTVGMLSLFGDFSQMQLSVNVNDVPDGVTSNQSFTYTVLGKGLLNSTQYLRVEFITVGVGNDVVAWFNPSGGVDRVDVLGERNYTGSGAYVLAQAYTTAFALIPAISNNATLLSLLSRTSETTTSIGPTQMSVTTYSLAVPSAPYSSLTVRYGTIPGTNTMLAVYLSEKMTDGSTTLVQITSLTK